MGSVAGALGRRSARIEACRAGYRVETGGKQTD
jgi:hypothetical protein